MAQHYQLEQIKQARVGFQTGVLHSLTQKILTSEKRHLPAEKKTIELIWVTKAKIKNLNSAYRNKNQVTDVLSFSYLDDRKTEIIGQLFICSDVLRKQAHQQKHSYKQEAQILFVHGLLHLLGYDHETKAGFEEMKKKEQKYLGDKSGLVARSSSV